MKNKPTDNDDAFSPKLPAPQYMVGYARVSMSDQTNRRQIAALIEAGVDEADIFTDVASGKDMKRPGWEACWKDLREGNLLVVHSIDRLGRNLGQLVTTLDELHKKGANLKVLSMDIDTRTPTGMLIFQMMASFAQFERALINERTADGLRRAREAGRKGGARTKNPDDAVIAAHAKYGVTQPAWRSLGMSKSGFIKAVARIKREREKSGE